MFLPLALRGSIQGRIVIFVWFCCHMGDLSFTIVQRVPLVCITRYGPK